MHAPRRRRPPSWAPSRGSSRAGHRWGTARVRGASMAPTLHEGDLLLLRYDRAPAPGDLVVGELADGTVAVKRAVERRTTASGAAGWWLLSDDPSVGVDSRHRGPVPEQNVRAVVVARLWPRPRRL
ncbi:S24 family peptidase [Nocardioides marinus]